MEKSYRKQHSNIPFNLKSLGTSSSQSVQLAVEDEDGQHRKQSESNITVSSCMASLTIHHGNLLNHTHPGCNSCCSCLAAPVGCIPVTIPFIIFGPSGFSVVWLPGFLLCCMLEWKKLNSQVLNQSWSSEVDLSCGWVDSQIENWSDLLKTSFGLSFSF